MKSVKALIVFAGLAIFVAACGPAANNTANNANTAAKNQNSAAATPAPTIDQVQFAKDLYAKNCMICHKENGKGGKVTVEGKTIEPDDITTAKMKEKTDDKLAEYISEGFPDDGMPAFKDKLSPEQIKSIVRHVRVLQGS